MLNVGETAPDPDVVPGGLSEDTPSGMALNQLQTVAEEMGDEKEIVYSVLRGPIADTIFEYSNVHDIYLIVMVQKDELGSNG